MHFRIIFCMILPCFSWTYKHAYLPGGDPAGKHIYNRGSANGKRVQCNMGAKNHGVIMPDANKEYTINQLVGAAFGAAGQRCMALTTAVMVGDSQARIRKMRDAKTQHYLSERCRSLSSD